MTPDRLGLGAEAQSDVTLVGAEQGLLVEGGILGQDEGGLALASQGKSRVLCGRLARLGWLGRGLDRCGFDWRVA